MGKRRGEMKDMKASHGHRRLVFEVPTRGLLGYRSQFVIDTRGEGIMASRVIGFKKHSGQIERRDYGSMISMMPGKTAGYALANLQDRGVLYVGPAVEVYEGMVVGSVTKGNDMTVNPIKGKALTNMRASGSDESLNLTTPTEITLERGLEIMAEDEYLEVTPKSIRLRKQFLKETDRNKAKKAS
jgi:GTP-binding protein